LLAEDESHRQYVQAHLALLKSCHKLGVFFKDVPALGNCGCFTWKALRDGQPLDMDPDDASAFNDDAWLDVIQEVRSDCRSNWLGVKGFPPF
jgi:hypothetical protein